MSIQSLQTQAHELTDKRIEQQAREILALYRSERESILSLLKTTYAEYLVNTDVSDYWVVMNQYKRLEKLNKEMQGIFLDTTRKAYSQVKQGLTEVVEEGYYRSRYVTESFSGILGIKETAPLLNPLVTELAVTGDLDIWKAIRNERLKEIALGIVPKTGKTLKQILADNATADLTKIQQTVKQGFISGVSYNKQVESLKPIFANSAYKTQRVVRTEGNRCYNAGVYTESKTSNVSKKKRWIATLDDRTRDEHGALDGTTIGIDEYFRIGSDRALYPGNFTEARNNISCRCTTIEIIEGLEPTVRRGKNPITGKSEIITYKNYDEWKKEVTKVA
jgi:SPP1 gp7 family putative phage head morphogenesis protein